MKFELNISKCRDLKKRVEFNNKKLIESVLFINELSSINTEKLKTIKISQGVCISEILIKDNDVELTFSNNKERFNFSNKGTPAELLFCFLAELNEQIAKDSETIEYQNTPIMRL